MDILIIILSAATTVTALIAAVFAIKSYRTSSGKTEKDDISVLSTKIDVMQNAISKEMSNSRSENSKALLAIADRNDRQNEKITSTLETSVEKLTKSNEKKLEEMRATVDEKLTSTLTTRIDSSFKTVSDQLERLYKSLGEMKELSSGVTTNVTSLNRILTNVKARGTWAEYQLENILDQTIPNMYVKNYQPSGSRNFVEFAVKLPSGEEPTDFTYLPIDSKFPMEDYARLCSAADNADGKAIEEARKALEKRVIAEAADVSKYINPPETTPFAIMYLATEGLYSEIASSKNGVLEKIQNEYNVMIAGPTTVTALLNSVAMGMKTLAVNEKAHEISLLLEEVKKQYNIFDELLQKAKKKITEADKTIDDATKRNDIIQKKLRKM